jgi:predicted DNA-binding protein
MEKRLTVRMSESTYKKLEVMSERYGMPVNSIISFIVGQWLDNHYDLKEKVAETLSHKVLDELLENMMTHPAYMNFLDKLMQRELGKENEKSLIKK